MKPHLDIKHEGTLGDEGRVLMTFDENSIAHLMSVLTDLYSNRTLAVIREYSTNAWDAHVEAGNPAPILVTLPTALSPTLIIKDLGTGMSKDDITENFSKYGWSSKRETDDQVGTLGLGCKSGLTYTSQFTLVTTQDGITNTVLVTRETTGSGVVQIIDTVQTDEPNGTEVQIPCRDVADVRYEALEFFKFWERGTVLINGEEPPSVWDDPKYIKLDPDVLCSTDTQNSYCVMGNVPYAIPHKDAPSDTFGVIFRVPIGSVNFAPSREKLSDTKRTRETMATIREFVAKGIWRHVQATIDQQPNHREAFKIYHEWWRKLTYGNGMRHQLRTFTYKGDPFPVYALTPKHPSQTLSFPIKPRSYEADRSSRHEYGLTLDEWYKFTLHVVGYRGTAVTATTKKRVREYCARLGIKDGKVILYPEPFGAPWLTNQTVPRVRFDIIQKVRLPEDDEREARRERPKEKYRVIEAKGKLRWVDTLPESTVAWVPADYSGATRAEIWNLVSLKEDVAVVLKAQENAFKRDHPDIPHLDDWARQMIATIPVSGTEWDNFIYWNRRAAAGYLGSEKIPRGFKLLNPEDLADPELKSLIREWRDADKTYRFNDKMDVVYRLKHTFNVPVPQVPTAFALNARVEKVRTFYEGLLSLDIYDGNRFPYAKALNAFYIVKSQLHVIPIL